MRSETTKEGNLLNFGRFFFAQKAGQEENMAGKLICPTSSPEEQIQGCLIGIALSQLREGGMFRIHRGGDLETPRPLAFVLPVVPGSPSHRAATKSLT
jgi:hypothetical protein